MTYELAIIGGGPAGYSAGIYAGRSGISAVLFDKAGGGGLALLSPNIENYAGFESISGMELATKMQQHARKYVTIQTFEEVLRLSKTNDIFTVETNKGTYSVKAVLLCMGTQHRKLNIPGEQEFHGKGVSYCATCDGFFFKNKKVAVVGGGNSALIEAIYLKQIGAKEVFLIHRRDTLRAEKAYEDEALAKGVQIIYETHVEQILGETTVSSLELHNVKTEKKTKLPVNGVFVSIGEEPQNILAQQLNVKLDKQGYIVVDRQQRTNVKGVYAAGDITGGLRQVVTACAEGAIAALTSTEVLGKQYPY
jgi:thioredoxin reductase (NADPH)